MNNTLVKNNILKLVLTDLFVLAMLLILPTIYHLLPFPGYYMEPMRIALFTTYVLSGNKMNTLLLAIFIPIFTMLISGHPPMIKTSLISFELLINGIIFFTLLEKTKNIFISLFAAIILSKIFYYFIKFILLNFAIIEGSFISIDAKIQLMFAIILSVCFGFLMRRFVK